MASTACRTATLFRSDPLASPGLASSAFVRLLRTTAVWLCKPVIAISNSGAPAVGSILGSSSLVGCHSVSASNRGCGRLVQTRDGKQLAAGPGRRVARIDDTDQRQSATGRLVGSVEQVASTSGSRGRIPPDSRSVVYRVDPETMDATGARQVPRSRRCDRSCLRRPAPSRREMRTGPVLPVATHGVGRGRERGLAARESGYRQPTTLRRLPGRVVPGEDRMLAAGLATCSPPDGTEFALAGIGLVDLDEHRPIHQVPVTAWTRDGSRHATPSSPRRGRADGLRFNFLGRQYLSAVRLRPRCRLSRIVARARPAHRHQVGARIRIASRGLPSPFASGSPFLPEFARATAWVGPG